MLNLDNFAITLGRAVEALRGRPRATDEHKRGLRKLVALTTISAVALRLTDGQLTAEGKPVAATLPGIRTLITQMDAHGVEEIRIGRNAAAADLLHLLRALAVSLGGYAEGEDIADRMRASQATSVTVLTVHPEMIPPGGRPLSVTEAFDAGEREEALAEATAGTGPTTPLDTALASLALDPSAPDVLDLLTHVGRLVHAELDAGRPSGALRAVGELVRLEAALPDGSPRNSFGIALKRLLRRGMLQVAADRTRVPDDRDLAVAALQRGGSEATDVLLERLVQAQTLPERRHYFDLLRQTSEGVRHVTLMLGHPEWFVVRNVADLLGELRVREAVPALARALRHRDSRVRRSAAFALARIGTAETVESLASVLRDDNVELRMTVAGAAIGHDLEGLAPALVLALEKERHAQAIVEYCRALGRLGSAPAVQALVQTAQPTGWRFWRRRPGARLAAIEGLKIAAGPTAIGALEALLQDRDPYVRRAAREALEDLDVL
ncbi:MAG: HEAT repeat domain-containing protein [Gemmatimonadota bacterium]|nr:HEAT repeat domain-containing protein [Gemmatimonadota bacterium]